MSKCGNCGAKLSCGCQRRALADGRMGCNKCSMTAKIKQARVSKASTATTNTTTTAEKTDAPIINQANIKE